MAASKVRRAPKGKEAFPGKICVGNFQKIFLSRRNKQARPKWSDNQGEPERMKLKPH